MSKTKEELNALKEEKKTVSRKSHALSDDELEQVTGGKFTVVKKIPMQFQQYTTIGIAPGTDPYQYGVAPDDLSGVQIIEP